MKKYGYKKPVYKIAVFIMDMIGGLVFCWLRIFKKRAPSDPSRILVVRLDHIGDFVCTTPLFRNIKKKFPAAKITVLINSASKELAYRDPNVDKVITFSPFYLARNEKSSTFRGLMRVVKDVRNIGFDVGLDPRGDLLSILIMWLGRVKYRVGYGITGGGFLLNKECRYDKSIHVVDRNLGLLKALGVPIEDKSPSVNFNEKDIETVEEIAKGIKREEKGISENGKSVVLHPFAGAETRAWAQDNFQRIVDRLKNEGISTYLVGTKNDQGNYKNVTDMRGKLSLPQLAYFIKSVGSFIGLNSGPANIAAALKVPSVVISSGSNIIEHWIPVSDNTRFIYRNIECRPCEASSCPKGDYECMQGISVDEIIDKFKEIASPATFGGEARNDEL
jgi:heptosyltransferase-2